MRRLKKGIYVETGFHGGTVAGIATAEGTVLVNSPRIPHEARQWKRDITRSAKTPLIYLFYTDHSPDHILGAQYLDAPVIAHYWTYHEMCRYGETFRNRLIESYRSFASQISADFEQLRIVMPQVLFAARLNLYKGARTFQFIHVGGANKAASVLYIPEDRILFAGNLVVNGRHPVMGEAQSEKWLAALDLIEGMDIDLIVPGYGKVCKIEAVHTMREYVTEIRAQVQTLCAAGRSRDDVVKRVNMLDYFPIPPKEKDVVVKRIRQSARRIYDEFANRI